jgi:glycerophosphoryl diester phosphodiesterase
VNAANRIREGLRRGAGGPTIGTVHRTGIPKDSAIPGHARSLLVAVAGAVVVVVVAGAGPASAAEAGPGCGVAARQQLGGGCGTVAFAHRGARGTAVDENTTEALEAAFAKHAFMETDLWLTQDRGFVIMHDQTLDRTTDCTGDVADWTLEDIRTECRTEPNDQRIPSFNRMATVLSHNPGQLLMVEIKGDGWLDNDDEALMRLRGAASDAGVLEQVYFTHDAGTETIEALRDVAPDARTAWKPDAAEDITPARARELSVDAVVAWPDQWTSRAKVHEFRSAGFLAWSRLVNDGAGWKRLIRRDVTAVMTDRPGAFRKLCARMAS